MTRNGVTRKRINVLDAATRNVNNNDFATAETFAGNGPFNDFDFNVCSDTEAGEPGPFSIDNGVWWTWTPATTGTATISTEDNGTQRHHVRHHARRLHRQHAGHPDDRRLRRRQRHRQLRSLVTFPVNGGTTYRIKVDGFGAANGLLNLHIAERPAAARAAASRATIVGTAGNDVINGTAGNDVIVAGAGNDTINGLRRQRPDLR